MTPREKRTTYLLALVAVCLAGCGSAGTASGARSSQPAPSRATKSSDPSRSTMPTASSAAPVSSAAPASPSPEVIAPARDGDVDGDGRPDQVTVSQAGSGWRLTAALTRLGTQTLQLAGTTGNPVSLEGVVDLDHDGRAEIALQLDNGASTIFSSIVRLVGHQLAQLKTSAGNIAELDSGGSVTHISEWGCRPPASGSAWQLWQWGGTTGTPDTAAASSGSYSGTEQILSMRGDTLLTVSTARFQDRHPPTGGCGSLHL